MHPFDSSDRFVYRDGMPVESRKRNPHEAQSFSRDLASSQITPAAVERRLRQLRDELSDAIYFKHPSAQIESLQSRVADLEGVLVGAASVVEGPSARRERLEQAAFRHAAVIERLNSQAVKLARQIEGLKLDLNESIRLRDPAREIQVMREQIAARLAEHTAIVLELSTAQQELDVMAKEAHAEVGAQSPRATIVDGRAEALRKAKIRLASLVSELNDPAVGRDMKLLQTVRRELREAEEEVDTLTARGAVANPRRRSSRPSYDEETRADLAAGKLSMKDILRRMERYRRLLAETLAADPDALERIASLFLRIKGLESMTRQPKKAV